jgi:hypothetical protein
LQRELGQAQLVGSARAPEVVIDEVGRLEEIAIDVVTADRLLRESVCAAAQRRSTLRARTLLSTLLMLPGV